MNTKVQPGASAARPEPVEHPTPLPVLITTVMPDGEPLRIEQHGGRTHVLWDYRLGGIEAMIYALEGATERRGDLERWA